MLLGRAFRKRNTHTLSSLGDSLWQWPPSCLKSLQFILKQLSQLRDTHFCWSARIWTFLEAQGYGHQYTIMYQDNQSELLLENNGRKSSSKRYKHLNCQFYFITDDRFNKNELSVEYCPNIEIVGDFFTKPCKLNSFTSSENSS
jgi:hypothetical protein